MIKRIIPLKVKVFASEKIRDYKLNKKYKSIKDKKKFFIFGTPNHGNLGDQAIISAEVELLKNNFKEHDIVEVDIAEYKTHVPFIKKYMKETDILFIHGGGNFGNQYIHDEIIRRDVIDTFKENSIIMFPQTIYFTNNNSGRKELEKSREIYRQHKQLTLIAREKVSYDLMKENFENNNILLVPDIVLYLNKSVKETTRSKALFCMRSDVESKFDDNERRYILDTLKNEYKNVIVTDTVITRNVTRAEREDVLETKYNEFREAELVVTDRIHGMIFAVITGTPCVVFSNYNQKVKGTYEWIKNIKYIKFIENLEQLPTTIKELQNANHCKDEEDLIENYYRSIVDLIKSKI